MRKNAIVRFFTLFLAISFIIPVTAIAVETDSVELLGSQADLVLFTEIEPQNANRVFGSRNHHMYDEFGQRLPFSVARGQNATAGNIVASTRTVPGYRVLRYQSTVRYIFRPIQNFSPYVQGRTATTFAPGQNITRAEVAVMFHNLSGAPAPPANAPTFPDVSATAWHRPAVQYLAARGVVTGDGRGRFNPNTNITRAEFAAMLARYGDLTIAASSAPIFPDVGADRWYRATVETLAREGWMTGLPGDIFGPARNITRAEVVTAINRMDGRTAINIPADVDNPFTDVPRTHWAFNAIISASRWHDCEWHAPEPFARGIENFHAGTGYAGLEFFGMDIWLGLGRTLLPSREFQANPAMRPDAIGTVSNSVRVFPTTWDYDNPGGDRWPQHGQRFLGLEYEINWIFISDTDYATYGQWITWP